MDPQKKKHGKSEYRQNVCGIVPWCYRVACLAVAGTKQYLLAAFLERGNGKFMDSYFTFFFSWLWFLVNDKCSEKWVVRLTVME